MKITYINGYNGENSSKAKLLKKRYKAEHIILKNEFNPEEVCQKLKEIKPQIVVASSTACFVADSCKYDKVFSFKKGGHRFNNIEDLFEIIEYPEYYLINEEFRNFFSKDELKKLLDLTTVIDCSTLIVNTQNYMFEIARGMKRGLEFLTKQTN